MTNGPADSRAAESLPKDERIQSRQDFLRAYEAGVKVHGRFIVVFAAPSETGRTRVGVTVTRKSGNAVVRNRLKRWVRETWRRNRAQTGFLAVGPMDLVVNAKPSAAEASFGDFSEDLLRTLRKALRTGSKA
jgi:ribonuclease P protein component